MARPKHRTAPSVPVSARVEPEVASVIDAMAVKQGVRRADVVRQIINGHIEAGKKEADTDGQL
ncbi:hypothetical protein ACR2VJ_27605 [Klebsiella pneumoniae]